MRQTLSMRMTGRETMINNEDKYIKYILLFALAYFGGHVLYYIGLELSCYLYGVLQ
jgi:hypothetical protein